MGEMPAAETIGWFADEEECLERPGALTWEQDEAFLRALCELLEIQIQMSGKALLICQEAPDVLH